MEWYKNREKFELNILGDRYYARDWIITIGTDDEWYVSKDLGDFLILKRKDKFWIKVSRERFENNFTKLKKRVDTNH